MSFVASSSQAKGLSFRKSFPRPISCRVLPLFSSNSFSAPDFKLRSWINLGLIFVQGNSYSSVSFHSYARGLPVSPALFVEDGAFLPV